jgi:hypothetical protein
MSFWIMADIDKVSGIRVYPEEALGTELAPLISRCSGITIR